VPRDYKHRAQPQPPSRQLPGWLWLLTGLALGSFVWALFWLHGQSGDGRAEWASGEPERPPQREAPVPSPAREAAVPEPRFDFYHVLPKDVVDVPRPPPPVRVEPRPPRPDPPAAPVAPVEAPDSYALQVGSFRRAADADRRKAELTLLGFDVRVRSARLTADDIRYRVFLGPYRSQVEVREARDRLAALGFESLVVSAAAP
jgi:cell division protein FtsN